MNQINRIRDENDPQTFPAPRQIMTRESADMIVSKALDKWKLGSKEDAQRVAATLEKEFPDQASPNDFWHSQSSGAFRDFFVWGHNHDFGCGITRLGAMDARHQEITSEAIQYGMLPQTLEGKQVLDVGCWSGGDLLVLAGLGGQVTAMEEHPVASRATRRLVELLGLDTPVVVESLYADRQEWAGRFDYAYCSGVIYHVTDPMLLLRILFAYLKPGGEVFLETKATTGEGSVCSYSGTVEKGWNWYAPNETALGRWLVDVGFDTQSVRVYRRANGRLLAYGRKTEACALRETAGFSRPGSWLEGVI
ncbi:class I SAM-dependent methyltransferase [Sulfurirhabdus autotrophica]|uniref:Methyltransferase family protein n=1 Tax=Sulfurirhabdus autotrophica TaxID=1706046 RepID=A0A4R3XW29_9PROT|nr:class I SAM-dependent methyltransferase [Sulfurirhabdus autotrophica]TCV83400.1 methyltransferase family protein [Sulfurirhabdus autotrophica]